MNYVTKMWVAGAALAVAVGFAGSASAQYAFRDAASKVRGDYGFAHQSASRSLYHARDYATDYSAYVDDAQQSDRPINPEVTQQHADGLGQNIQHFQKHLDTVRNLAGDDSETQASLDVIDNHVQEASKHQADLAEHAKQPTVDAEGSVKSSNEASKSLNAAIAEHDKLLKKLGTKPQPTK